MKYSNPNDHWRPGQPDPLQDISDEERTARTICHTVCMVMAVFVIMTLCAMCSSCTTTKYIPVPEYHTDTLIVTQHQQDSVYIHDSIMVKQKGDTVEIDRWHTKYVSREVHDTIYKSRIDSISYPVEIVTTELVERPLIWYEKLLMWAGGISLIMLAIWLYFKLR